MYEWIERAFEVLIRYGVMLLELIGTAIILYAALRSVWMLVRGKKQNIRIYLGESIALALEFKLGSEVLRTVIARDLHEVLVIAAIMALRAAMTLLIHWEVKHEKGEEAHGGKDH